MNCLCRRHFSIKPEYHILFSLLRSDVWKNNQKFVGVDRSVGSSSAGFSRFPSYHWGTQNRLPPGFVPWDPAPVFLHCIVPSGESVIHTNHSFDLNLQWFCLMNIKCTASNVLSTQTLPHRLQILVAVVQYKTKLYKPRRGLCSTWLASLDPTQGPSTKLLS